MYQNALFNRLKTALLSKYVKQDGTINYSAAHKELKVSRQALMDWTKGRVDDMRISNVLRIEEKTGYAFEWIATGRGPEKVTEKKLFEIYKNNKIEESLHQQDINYLIEKTLKDKYINKLEPIIELIRQKELNDRNVQLLINLAETMAKQNVTKHEKEEEFT